MDTELIQRPFGVYEKAIRPQEWEKMLTDTSSAEYRNYEVSLGENDARLARLHRDDKQYDEVRRVARNQNIRILSACFSRHRRFSPGSSSRDLEERGIRMMREGIALCQNLGVRILQAVRHDAFYEPRSHETATQYKENILKCLEWVEQTRAMLAIEPVEVNLVKVSDTLHLVREADSSWLQIYPDIASTKSLGIDPVTGLPQGRGHIANVHVRDLLPGYPHEVPLGTENMDFIGVFKALDAVEYRGSLTAEMWNEMEENYTDIISGAWTFMIDKTRRARCS